MNDIEKAIEELKSFSNGNKYDTEYTDLKVFDLAISALEKQLNSWIPVSERLPNRETGCLVWQKIDGHYKYNIWHYVTDFPSSVIAWQPLPSTYKEVEHED